MYQVIAFTFAEGAVKAFGCWFRDNYGLADETYMDTARSLVTIGNPFKIQLYKLGDKPSGCYLIKSNSSN